MYFEWKEIYNIDIGEIDKQHKKLFDIGRKISALVFTINKNNTRDEIEEILNDLENYTLFHFNYEEKLMEKHGFTDLDTHKMEHAYFIKRLTKLKKKHVSGNRKESFIELIAFVSNWIAQHTLNADMKYKGLLNDDELEQ